MNTAAKQLKKLSKQSQIDVSKYQREDGLSMPQRAAHFLDWAAQNYPGQIVAYNVTLKAVQGYTKMPILKSKEVEQLRSGMTRVRAILQEKYAREMVTSPGAGVRATVDSLDTAQHSVPKKIVAVKRSKDSLAKTMSLVKVNEIPDTAEYKVLKAWIKRDVGEVMKGLSALEDALRLPPTAAEPVKP